MLKFIHGLRNRIFRKNIDEILNIEGGQNKIGYQLSTRRNFVKKSKLSTKYPNISIKD